MVSVQMSNSIENLRQVIEEAFPKTSMPEPSSIFDASHPEHASLTIDMIEIKGKLGSNFARSIHQELRWLTPIGFLWAMPYYLDFCLSEEGQYSSAETQFLVFLFAPEHEYFKKELSRYDFLSTNQLLAISLFFIWCKGNNALGLLNNEYLDAANQFIDQALMLRHKL
jgi:hypothetical protein